MKQIETDTYTVDSTGKIGAMDTCCNYTEEFDDSGHIDKYITKDGKGNLKSEQSFIHNDKGMLVEMNTTTNNKKTSSLKLDFDKGGKYSIAKSYHSTEKMDSYYDEITINENGQVTGATQHHLDSNLKMSFTSNFEKQFYIGGESKDSTGKIAYSSKIKTERQRRPNRNHN